MCAPATTGSGIPEVKAYQLSYQKNIPVILLAASIVSEDKI